MEIPIIETERVTLYPPSLDCFEAYEAFYTDEEASKMYGGPMSGDKIWSRLMADLGSWYLLGFGVWAIKHKKRYVGTCGFWQGKGWPRELTWWLLPEVRGKGLAYESSVAVVSLAYREFNWDVVETYMKDENIPARNLVERLGGVKKQRKSFPDGNLRDIYEIPNLT